MKDPCERCLVQAICREECDELVIYIGKRMKGLHMKFGANSYERYIAKGLRKGVLILRETSIRRKQDGSTMCCLYSK